MGDQPPLPALFPLPLKKQIRGTENREPVRPFSFVRVADLCSIELLLATDDSVICRNMFQGFLFMAHRIKQTPLVVDRKLEGREQTRLQGEHRKR